MCKMLLEEGDRQWCRVLNYSYFRFQHVQTCMYKFKKKIKMCVSIVGDLKPEYMVSSFFLVIIFRRYEKGEWASRFIQRFESSTTACIALISLTQLYKNLLLSTTTTTNTK